MKIMNPDVPESTIIRQLVEENRKLKHKVANLENELAHKKRAILGFKEWQKNVAEYKYNYWLGEGTKFIRKGRVSSTDRFKARNLSYQITETLREQREKGLSL